MKILLVDDSEIMLLYVSSLLSSQGLKVIARKSLLEAIEAFSIERPDAILSDFVLEGATGLECLSAILALAGGTKPRIAILTQGELVAADRAKALALGACILQKPKRGAEQDFLNNVAQWLS